MDKYNTIRVKWEDKICCLQLYRPEDKNSINNELIEECTKVIEECEVKANILILEGLNEIFCFGADFKNIAKIANNRENDVTISDPEKMYDLWVRISQGSFVSIAHVKGKANAGGIGFVSACDLVIAGSKAEFSLSELLFGLMPACVFPFLMRKIGYQKSHNMTLTTKAIAVQKAFDWGLVDDYEEDSDDLLRKYLLRLRKLEKSTISSYKKYVNSLDAVLLCSKEKALAANLEVFNNSNNINKIANYINKGELPW